MECLKIYKKVLLGIKIHYITMFNFYLKNKFFILYHTNNGPLQDPGTYSHF